VTIFLGSPPWFRNSRLKKRFAADHDAPFSEKVFNIAVTEIETVVEPDSVTDYI